MGTTSEQLMHDCLAKDIENDFDAMTLGGEKPDKAADHLLKKYQNVLSDQDEGPIVHLVLASLLLDCGVREHPVLEKAARLIDSGAGLARWREAGEAELGARMAVYRELRARLSRAEELSRRFPKPLRPQMPKVGDILQIPLSDGRFAYAQYVHFDPDRGALVQVLKPVQALPISGDDLDIDSHLIPPLICGINHAIREGTWQVVGHRDVKRFIYPLFKYGVPNKQGLVELWWVWDGKKLR